MPDIEHECSEGHVKILGSGVRDCFGFKIMQHFEVGSQNHSTQGSVNPLAVKNMYLRTHISKHHSLLPVRTFNLQSARWVKAFILLVLTTSCGSFCFYWSRGKIHVLPLSRNAYKRNNSFCSNIRP